MTTNTNFNTAPYFDDYDEEKNHHRILFRPSVPVQARELTQLQTITQNQIERFGKHVFVDGSIVDGCALSFDSRYNYIKIKDQYGNGATIITSDLQDKILIANTDTRAIVVNNIDGLEAQAPDLKTLYIKYIRTGRYANGVQQQKFDANSVLTIQTNDGSATNVGTLQVDSNTSAAVGVGYGVSVAEGTIFQKGFFIRVEPQTIVLTKYTNFPHNYSVGFETQESIITPEIDESLLDNALGSPNYTAPGAHRLKLTPVLTSRKTVFGEQSNNSNFFSIADFTWGTPTAIKTDATYANLGKELAKRTYEESGDYVLTPFIVTSSNNSSNTSLINLDVDAGLGYVKGYRVQQLGRRSLTVPKGNDYKFVNSATTTASMGNYIVVNEVAGGWNFLTLANVSLANTAAQAVTAAANSANLLSFTAPVSNTIGTATLKAIEYNDNIPGQNTYQVKLYLTNIRMNTGMSFQDVKSVYTNVSSTSRAIADVVLTGGKAVLQETNLDNLVFSTGKKALRNFKNSANATVTQFTFKSTQTLSVNTAGGTTLTHSSAAPGGTETLTYGVGALSTTAVRSDFTIIANTGADCVNVGTATATAGSNTVTGSGTFFTSQFPGNTGYIKVFNTANTSQTEVKLVTSVTSDTVLNVSNNFAFTHAAGNAVCRTFPQGSIINPAGITVSSTTSATVNVAANNSFVGGAGFNVTVYYPVNRSTALPKLKTVNKNRFVKIVANSVITNTDINTKSIYLGMPDVIKIRNVYVGNSTNHSTTNPNVTDQFILDTGQKDDFYGPASIRLKPAATLTLSNTDTGNCGLLVEFDHFTHSEASGSGFFTIESYPIDDANTANTTAITTQEIPIFYSPTDATATDLRDSIDFRPICANTVVSTTVVGSANTITGTAITTPSITFAPGAYGPYIPRTDTNVYSAFSYYIGRKLKVTIDQQGILSTIPGIPSEYPTTPRDKDGALTIATINIPPYPSLPQSVAKTYNRPDYSISIDMQKNRRYTMRDIGTLAERIDRLEYYTSLSLLEKAASDLLITDNAGIQRFKNGFLVEPFKGFDIADTTDPEFKIAIDPNKTEARPRIARQNAVLEIANTSVNAVKTANLVSLPFVSNNYIEQPFATKYRNCVEGLVFEWRGNVELNPEGDYAADENRNADVVINLDLASNWLNLVDAWPTSWGDWQTTSSWTGSSTTTAGVAIRDQSVIIQTTTSTTTNNVQNRNGTDLNASVTQNSYYAGDYITDISIQPYMRRRAIKFRATSLKPNTKLTPFFDDVNVSAYTYSIPSPSPNTSLRNVVDLELSLQRGVGNQAKTIAQGTDLVTDEYGVAYGIFYLPDGVFKTGDRVFKLVDVDNLATGSDSITTIASATYTGSNYTISKSRLSLNTREAQISQSSVSQQRVITTSQTSTNETVVGTRQDGDTGQLWRTLVNQGLATAALGQAFHDIGWWDPIAQTFMINEIPAETPGIFVSKIDVYFQSKDSTLGIELQLREVENGFPTTKIVPFSRVIKRSADVNTSTNGSVATTFTFDAPVFLQAGKEYAMVIIPNGNSPNYNIWCSELGGTDVYYNVPVHKNLGAGVLLVSSTNRVWTPYQKEDLKFAIYRAEFTSLSGNVVFENTESEYLTTSSLAGTFIPGEKVFQSNGVLSSNAITASSTSLVLNVGSGVNAQTAFAAADMIFIANAVASQIKIVNNVPNTTAVVLTSNTDIANGANVFIGKIKGNGSLTSRVFSTIPTKNSYTLSDSTANSTVYYTPNLWIFGDTSGAFANVASVDNFDYSIVVPQFSDLALPGTTLQWYFKGYSNTGVADTGWTQVTEGIENENTDLVRRVYSRSNEVVSLSSNKSLQFMGVMTSSVNKISPVIDDIKSSALLIQNLINTQANTLNETTTLGNALSKYISKQVVLADGMDAEDIRVYLAAYMPQGTNVQVYGKFLHREDPDSFTEKSWTLLDKVTPASVYSVTSNRDDIREFEYSLPSVNATATTAYLDAVNGITYTNKDGVVFRGYKTFAVKIVLQSDTGTHLVPRVSDMRAIALQL